MARKAFIRQIAYETVDTPDELPTDEALLLQSAQEAAWMAYAPFSRFRVGCGLLLSDGSVITGNNQENAAFPSGLCAERVALFYAGALGKASQVVKVAVWAASDLSPEASIPTSCGACRQVMVEYEKQCPAPWVILFQGPGREVLRLTGVAENLVPFVFEGKF